MKFLCGNCKAKYQIADEKVSGRTLRMKCRRCGHDILIDGHGMTPSMPPAAPAPARKPGASSVIPAPPQRSDGQARGPAAAAQPPAPGRPSSRSRPPSALTQDFRRHVAAPPEVPQRTAPYDLWHVAIQDVPVGPMTREELARKVESGAVSGESLCWREGMDDWRPMSELAELAQLLRRARPGEGSWSGRPPPRRRDATGPVRGNDADLLDDDVAEPVRKSIAPAAPAFVAPKPVPARPQEPSLPMPAVSARIPAFQPSANPFQQSAPAQYQQPVQQTLPTAAPLPAFTPQPMQPMQQIPGEPSVAQALPAAPSAGSKLLSPQAVTGVAIGLLMGILGVGGPMLYRNTWGSNAAPPAQGAATPVTPAVTPTPSPTTPELVIDVPDEKPVVEPEKPVAVGKPTTTPVRGTKTDTSKEDTTKLSDAERKLLERMGGSGASGPNLEGVGKPAREDAPSGPALTANQLMGVVQNNKVQLQRCYETALRASGGKQDGAIKVTVNVTVGAPGSVKGVVTQGNGPSTMNDCLKSSVKRWRFPQSGGESEFAFPLVFQPGA